MARGIHGQGERAAASRNRDVHELLGAFGPEVAERGLAVERGANEHQGVVVELDTAIADRLTASPRGGAGDGHVVGDIPVETEGLGLRCLALEVQEIRRAGLLHAHPAAPEIERPSVPGDRKRLTGRVDGHVLAEIPVRALAFEHQGLHGTDPARTAQGGGDVGEQLLIGRGGRARGAAGEGHGREQASNHGRDDATS